MVDFSRFSNTDLSTTPFQYVIFGAKGGLLEVELNEAQYLAFKRDYLALKSIGNMSIDASVTRNIDGLTTFTGDFIINGYAVCLNDCSISTEVGDTIYINLSLETLTKDDVIKSHGYVDGEEVTNTIVDDRFGIETTQRRAIKLQLSTSNLSGYTPIAKINSDGSASLLLSTTNISSSINTLNNLSGLQSKTTVFNEDGSITETNADGSKKITVFNEDGSITETSYDLDEKVTMLKNTVFNADGSITETIE